MKRKLEEEKNRMQVAFKSKKRSLGLNNSTDSEKESEDYSPQ
jgi:hypothetical protein